MVFLFTDTDRVLHDPIEVCDRLPYGLKGVGELYWLDEDRLVVLDPWTEQLVVIGRNGDPLEKHTIRLPGPGGVVDAFPIGTDQLLIAFSPAGSFLQSVERAPRVLHQLSHPENHLEWSVLLPPKAVRDGTLNVRMGVRFCVGPQDQTENPRFVALNPWIHELFLGEVEDTLRVFRANFDRQPSPVVRGREGIRVPAAFAVAISCGHKLAVAKTSFRDAGWLRPDSRAGVLDVIRYDGTPEGRFLLGEADPFLTASDIGLDQDGFAYGLVRDSTGGVIIRAALIQPSPW